MISAFGVAAVYGRGSPALITVRVFIDVVVDSGRIVFVRDAICRGTLNVLYELIVYTFTADEGVARIESMLVTSTVDRFSIRFPLRLTDATGGLSVKYLSALGSVTMPVCSISKSCKAYMRDAVVTYGESVC